MIDITLMICDTMFHIEVMKSLRSTARARAGGVLWASSLSFVKSFVTLFSPKLHGLSTWLEVHALDQILCGTLDGLCYENPFRHADR